MRNLLMCGVLLGLGAVLAQPAAADGGVVESATAWSFSGIVAKNYTTSIPGVTLFIEFTPALDAQETAVFLGGAPRILLPFWPELMVCRIRVDIDPHNPTSNQKLNTNWELLGSKDSHIVYACLVPGSNVFKLDLLGLRKSSIDPPIGHFTVGKAKVWKTFTLELYVQELEGQMDEATKTRYWEQRYAPQGLAHRKEVVVSVQSPAPLVKCDPELEGKLTTPSVIAPTTQPWAFEFKGFGDQRIRMWLAPVGSKDKGAAIEIKKEQLPNGNRFFIPIADGSTPPAGTRVRLDVEIDGVDWGSQDVTLESQNFVIINNAPIKGQEVTQ